MANLISKIKTPNNVTYDIQDNVSTFGGTNLLTGTKFWEGWYTNGSTVVTFNDGIANLATRTTRAWTVISSPCIPFSQIVNKDITFSCEIRSDEYASLPDGVYPNICFYLKDSGPQATNYTTRLKGTPGITAVPTNDWTKIEYGFKNITLANFTNSYAEGNYTYMAVNFWLYQLPSVQFRKCKLEIGSKSTDWSPAPQDLVTYNGTDTIEFFQ